MEFYRTLMKDLEAWRVSPNRKPLLLHGARQTGKTWLVNEFGRKHFRDVASFNFNELDMEALFVDKNPERIIKQLSYLHGTAIQPQTTLIFFDEIQENKVALNSMKYFYEQLPEMAVVCAGSLLSANLDRGDTFPVGTVDHYTIYPLTFSEYLHTADEKMYEYLIEKEDFEPILPVFLNRIQSHFNSYLISGGMPAAASCMLRTSDMEQVDATLQDILDDYELDFAKYAVERTLITRIGHIWRSIPAQLSKENRKFMYQMVRSGARAREYEDALVWLEQTGLIYKVNLNKKPKLPLSAYDDPGIFKIYLSDIGLLRKLAQLLPSAVLSTVPSLTNVEFKGAFVENYVLQSLKTQYRMPLRYWTGRTAEVDFILLDKDNIIPLEVKSGRNARARGLQAYGNLFQPLLKIRYSEENLMRDDDLINLPFFMCDFTRKLITKVSKEILEKRKAHPVEIDQEPASDEEATDAKNE